MITRSIKYNESFMSYLEEMRPDLFNLANKWLQEYSQIFSDGLEMRNKLYDVSRKQYQGALFQLYLHKLFEYIYGLNSIKEVNNDPSKPECQIIVGSENFFVEATLIHDPSFDNDLSDYNHHLIDQIISKIPQKNRNVYIRIRSIDLTVGKTSPSTTKLSKQLDKHIDSFLLNPERDTFTIVDQNFKADIQLLSSSQGIHLAGISNDVYHSRLSKNIRDDLRTKCKQHEEICRKNDKDLLVCMNCNNHCNYPSPMDIATALYGTEAFSFTKEGKLLSTYRKDDGSFKKSEIIKSNVLGILFVNDLSLFSKPGSLSLWLNPWKEIPAWISKWKYDCYQPSGDQIVLVPGKESAQLF